MHISPSSEKSEIVRFRCTEFQLKVAQKTYRSLGFETMSQYMRYLLNESNHRTIISDTAENVVSLNQFKQNQNGQNCDTNRPN